MKKIMTFFMVMAMIGILAGCSGKETAKADIASSEELLNKVWDAFPDDAKFPATGGDAEHMKDNAAGNVSLEEKDTLMYVLYVPESSLELIDDAASLMHMMNSNTFTGAAFHLKDADSSGKFVENLKENIMNTQWMCGFPDELSIFTVNGEYVVSAFGKTENMENFKAKVQEVYGDSAVLEVEANLS